jgi:hypothetical protein
MVAVWLAWMDGQPHQPSFFVGVKEPAKQIHFCGGCVWSLPSAPGERGETTWPRPVPAGFYFSPPCCMPLMLV